MNKIWIFKKNWFWITIFCVLGYAAVIYSTRLGAVLTDDSYYYIHAARDLIAGNGFKMNPHFPPMLSLVLAFFGKLFGDPLNIIRWLNALLFAANAFLSGWLVWKLTRSTFGSIITSFVFISSSHLIEAHAWAMSEPLYILLMLLGIMLYFLSAKRQMTKESNNVHNLKSGPILSGFCFGLAALTRYIGSSLLLSGGLTWLFVPAKTRTIRQQNFILFSITGLVPNLVWFMRNIVLYGKPTSRSFNWHPAPIEWWRNAIDTMTLWFIPGRFVYSYELFWLVVWFLVILGGLSLVLAKIRYQIITSYPITPKLQTLLAISFSVISYFLILVFSRTFMDPSIPSDPRIFAPVWSILIIIIAVLALYLWQKWQHVGRIMAVMLLLVPLITNVTRSIDTINSYHEFGRIYSSTRHHNSETYAYLKRFPQTPIYSNAFAAIYFWIGRTTFPLPQPDHITTMKDDLEQNGGFLVIFDSVPLELYNVTREELTEGLIEVIRLSEARIYKYP